MVVSLVAHGLRCSKACGGLPGSRMEPMSPAVTGGFFPTEPPEKPGSFCACLWLKVLSS